MLQMNGDHDRETSGKEVSPSRSPISRFGSPIKKVENGDTTRGKLYCDVCEKNEFVNEVELMTHKKLHHNKLTSPGRVSLSHSSSQVRERFLVNQLLAYLQVSIESGESNEDQVKKHKTSPSSSSPPSRYDGLKKSGPTAFNGDANSSNNNATSCEICEKRDFANEAELQSHKKLIHHTQNMKLSSSSKVSYFIVTGIGVKSNDLELNGINTRRFFFRERGFWVNKKCKQSCVTLDHLMTRRDLTFVS